MSAGILCNRLQQDIINYNVLNFTQNMLFVHQNRLQQREKPLTISFEKLCLLGEIPKWLVRILGL